jgi:hypothetical protein
MESWRLARNGAKAVIGNINFMIAFRASFKNIEAIFPSFFKRQWKSQNKLPEAYVFDTDRKVGKPITLASHAAKESFYLVQDKLMDCKRWRVSRVH